jgi:hypothetical protein
MIVFKTNSLCSAQPHSTVQQCKERYKEHHSDGFGDLELCVWLRLQEVKSPDN